MPKQKTDDLVQLIRSLTRAEKRHFRLFVRRNQASDDILFLQLFDVIDKMQEYEEDVILKKLPAVKKTQLSNLKAHLYKQLLISLRLLSRNHVEDIQVREMVDYARFLYNKGLYRQALEMLDKAKERAYKGHFYPLALEIVEFERHIESQYVTGSIEGRAELLSTQAEELTRSISHTHQFASLSLQLYSLYLKIGLARNSRDYHMVREFFQSRLPKTEYEQLDFMGKIYYCQAHLWYYHITQDFTKAYRHSQRWVDLFNGNPELKLLNIPLYLKGLHNLLGTLFNMLHYPAYLAKLEELERFPQEFDLSESKNVEGLFFLFKYIHTIRRYFIEGNFSEGLHMVPELMEIIDEDRFGWDQHRVMVFYYQIACLYFGSGNNDEAISYLNLIINQKNPDYREDIQCFARILNLIAHYEMGNAILVEYQIKSVYRFLSKMENLQQVQKEIFKFLRRLPKMRKIDMKQEFESLHKTLKEIDQDPFERRPFLYLDIISWLESKIQDKPVQLIIRQKFLKREKMPVR